MERGIVTVAVADADTDADVEVEVVDPVPVADGGTEPSHIEEGCDVSLKPGSGDEGVTVARLIRENATWRVDPDFVPSRLQHRRS